METLKGLLQGQPLELRQAAIAGLATMEHESVIPKLLSLLDSAESENHWRIVAALHKLGWRAVQPLAAGLRDPDARVRRRALHYLARIAHPSTVNALAAVMKEGEPGDRAAAAAAVAAIKDPRSPENLVGALKDWHPDTRLAALRGLAEFNQPNTVEDVAAALRDKQDHVRGAAASALGKMKRREAVEPLIAARAGERRPGARRDRRRARH